MDRSEPADGSIAEESPRDAVQAHAIPSGATDTDPELNAALAAARIRAIVAVARYHGLELDAEDFRGPIHETTPSALSLIGWAREHGLWAKAVKMRWKQLFRFNDGAPVVLLFNDGGAGLLVGVNSERHVVFLKDPSSIDSSLQQAVPVDETRLAQVWSGEVILLRRARGESEADAPFSLGWVWRIVTEDWHLLRDIGIASMCISALTVIPPLLTMGVIDRVVTHHSLNTLGLLGTILLIMTVYETLLTWGRREVTVLLSSKLDAKLNLHVFSRLLVLPLTFFERNRTGETLFKLSQISKIREFLTGKLLSTFLDMFTLVILLPLLFYMNSDLAWIVLVGATLIALIIMVFLPSLRSITGKLIAAESDKGAVMNETVQGIRTVKTLALEPVRKSDWDARVAAVGRLRLRQGRTANWAQTAIMPIESFINRGVIMVGAYIALTTDSPAAIGGLVAFMMLGSRVAAPLVGLARMMEDFEEVRMAVSSAGSVLNQPTESKAMVSGMRPKLEGALSFTDVTFTYPGAAVPALKELNFEIPAGTMLGLVGRSGSGKSTITRLLQGVNREYMGYLKLDGVDLKEINLTHLRRSLGVVLQDNFLFRGSVLDNIIAGRPGLTLQDAVRAARLAGAEEFIERLPQGYETFIDEGSTNISGGQRQRLAIARALISDPRLLILDEATSALDPESEALVNANLLRIGQGRTMVIVSHRLSSLVDCDLILVLDKGKAVDIGPHAELVERCAIYRQLWLQQNRHAGVSETSTHLTSISAQGN